MNLLRRLETVPALRNVEYPRSSARVASDVARDRAQLRRLIGQVDYLVVDITPAPSLRRIVAFDDRVARRMEMRGGVAMRRIIATADVAAGAAETQVHPGTADLQAFLAPACARRDFLDGCAVGTRCHVLSPRLVFA